MPDTPRTLATLLVDFADNNTGDITAQQQRDFTLSSFGPSFAMAPTANDDSANTGGHGFFDTGSRWNDTASGRLYFCASGAIGAAVWWALMYDGEAAGGRLAGMYPNPTLAASGVTPGIYGDGSHIPIIQIDADGTISAASEIALSGSGTVTSVALTAPSEINVAGSPVTTSGTLALTWNSQAANTVFAAPSGSSGTPAFRTLVANDIPALPASIITSGTFAVARIPGLPASIITSGTFSSSVLPTNAPTWVLFNIPYTVIQSAGSGMSSIHYHLGSVPAGTVVIAAGTRVPTVWTLSAGFNLQFQLGFVSTPQGNNYNQWTVANPNIASAFPSFSTSGVPVCGDDTASWDLYLSATLTGDFANLTGGQMLIWLLTAILP